MQNISANFTIVSDVNYGASPPPALYSLYGDVSMAVNLYIVPLLCVFGISGNILSIVVLGRDKSMKHSTRFLLQMLAVADLLFLITCGMSITFDYVASKDWYPLFTHYFYLMLPYTVPVGSTCQTCCVWFVVLVTCDRYIAICMPLHASQYSTTSRARKAVLVVSIASVVFNLPRFFEKRAVTETHPITNTTSVQIDNTAIGGNWLYEIIYTHCLWSVFRFLLPLSALVFFNTRLIQAIRNSNKMHSRDPGSSQSSHHTRILVVLVLVFVVCLTPDSLVQVYMTIFLVTHSEDFIVHAYVFKIMITLSNLCLIINSSINFVIYCCMGQRFRSILRQKVCSRSQTERIGH